MQKDDITIWQGDCLTLMADIPDKSVDMILCDLPYGTTACKWDTAIPFEPLWAHYERVIKERGAIVLTSSQPFTSQLIMSNPKRFRYEWIWEKSIATGFFDANKKPLKAHENILVFGLKAPVYYPQKTPGKPYTKKGVGTRSKTDIYNNNKPRTLIQNNGDRYPKTIQRFSNGNHKSKHPTQKPVELMEYLIKTYTLPGETVLDNCMGSGSTGVACINTGRKFIGIEKDPNYFEIASKRIAEAAEFKQPSLFTAEEGRNEYQATSV